jgi:hypothetical protein
MSHSDAMCACLMEIMFLVIVTSTRMGFKRFLVCDNILWYGGCMGILGFQACRFLKYSMQMYFRYPHFV